MSRLFGLTCDSLQEVTMIDGKGNSVNSKDNPELLWACKGGGSGNFGIDELFSTSQTNSLYKLVLPINLHDPKCL